MSSPRGREANIFGLSLGLSLSFGFALIATGSALAAEPLASCNAVLVRTKVVLVASLSVIEITSFTLRSSLIANSCLLYNVLLKLSFEQCACIWYCCQCCDWHTGRDFLKNFMLERKRSYTVFYNLCDIAGFGLSIITCGHRRRNRVGRVGQVLHGFGGV